MQYIKKPLIFFVYRLIFSLMGTLLLAGLINKHVALFSLILLLFNIPVFYSSASTIAKDDKKTYHHTSPYGAKGLILGLLYLIPCAVVAVLMGVLATQGSVLPAHSGFLLMFMPYRALLTGAPNITYVLPVIIDLAVITLGYLAGMNNISVVRFFREHILFEKKDEKNS